MRHIRLKAVYYNSAKPPSSSCANEGFILLELLLAITISSWILCHASADIKQLMRMAQLNQQDILAIIYLHNLSSQLHAMMRVDDQPAIINHWQQSLKKQLPKAHVAINCDRSVCHGEVEWYYFGRQTIQINMPL